MSLISEKRRILGRLNGYVVNDDDQRLLLHTTDDPQPSSERDVDSRR